MKILEFQKRNNTIIENFECYATITNKQENHKIQRENYENNENVRISFQKKESHENLRIPHEKH